MPAFWNAAGKLYQRSKLKQTASALNGVPSWNVTPWRRLNVQDMPSGEASQLSASDGSTSEVPGLSRVNPSVIWYRTRIDSPSEISAPSSAVGSVGAA